VGYAAGAAAYHAAVAGLDAGALTTHYTAGLSWFEETFAPHVRGLMSELTGGVWDLSEYVAVASGSDVDWMTHLVEAVAAREGVSVYPGDWWGFSVGCTQPNIAFSDDAAGRLACVCLPSVRNGQLTEEMATFLEGADACLLNINLFPTLPASERAAIARRLLPVLPRSVLSISFSRGFGLTASQLGVALVHRDHPYVARFARQWGWFSYFHNAIAARALMALDLGAMRAVDDQRRVEVKAWLEARGLPVVDGGTYYVKSFRPQGPIPEGLRPLVREGAWGSVVRLCFKPAVV